jgi:uncharacterized protein HemY
VESPRIAKLMKMIYADGMNQSAHMMLGREYYSMGRWMEAAASFRRSTELNPDNFGAWLQMGEAYERAGVAKEAASAFNHAVHVANYLGNTRGAEQARACLSRLSVAA